MANKASFLEKNAQAPGPGSADKGTFQKPPQRHQQDSILTIGQVRHNGKLLKLFDQSVYFVHVVIYEIEIIYRIKQTHGIYAFGDLSQPAL